MDFSEFDAVLLDLDGTIYHEDHPLPGAMALIRRLQQQGQRYACLTNSTTSPQRLATRLRGMGVEVDPGHIYTAAAAAADYVLDRFQSAGLPRIFNLATDGVQEMLDGKVIWANAPGQACDGVIAGASTNVYATEERQRIALGMLRAGAELVGICADRVYPSPRGIEFGSGAFCAMLGYAANCAPVFCGKPRPVFFQNLCDRMGVAPGRCVLIGDNLESDIGGGRVMGMRTVLVLTGVTGRAELERVGDEQRPDHVIDDLRELG